MTDDSRETPNRRSSVAVQPLDLSRISKDVTPGLDTLREENEAKLEVADRERKTSGRKGGVLVTGNISREALPMEDPQSYYSMTMRGLLNELYTVSSIRSTGAFASKDSTVTSATKMFATATSAVPVAGAISSLVLNLTAEVMKRLEDSQNKELVDIISEINPANDTSEWNSFSKQLSRQLAATRAGINRDSKERTGVSELNGMTREDVKELVYQDFDRVLTAMTKKQVPSFKDADSNEEAVQTTAEAIRKEVILDPERGQLPERITKQRSYSLSSDTDTELPTPRSDEDLSPYEMRKPEENLLKAAQNSQQDPSPSFVMRMMTRVKDGLRVIGGRLENNSSNQRQ